ncbi:sensor histidine kinase [Pseudemcibacter aquimaris]|uniref:sensor histidine kinase n=1 Tax=Pseudemcibacter aquimaris TaxID=2857064 RepID=UPI0020112252|nr:ATP-binding protein [Pseudemcibacter aquimaris]MCC3859701.1 GHKL domain-containing protein [Pseudemcibacter aquimaris]WDU60096.1 GHKL domain-containing protein [Pseudemcibacter aquimaris]
MMLTRKIKALPYLIPFFVAISYLHYDGSIDLLSVIILVATALFSLFFLSKSSSRRNPETLIEYENSPSIFVDILENLADPFLILDENKLIIMANKSATEVFGADILRQDVSDYLKDAEALNAITKAIETGSSNTIEYATPGPKSKTFLLRIHVLENESDDDMDPIRTLFLGIYDITSVREAERMRVDFVANVSHELRTPLASILGFVETLMGPAKEDPVAAERFLTIMRNEANRMTRLIEDLLSLSHIERDVHIPPEEKVSLVKTIENVIETLNIRLDKREITTVFNFDPDLDVIIADRDQLTQVFQNLIDNAIKYGSEKSTITVGIAKVVDVKDQKEYAQIEITNEGQGIAPEHIERLTERFYRVDTARSRSLGGTGLGLAIVKHIIQRHEGNLHFRSKVGEYTTAIVNLPVQRN